MLCVYYISICCCCKKKNADKSPKRVVVKPEGKKKISDQPPAEIEQIC
jgi:hypothetical protein